MILAWPTFTKRMAAGNLSPSPSTKPRKIPCQIFVSLQGTRFKISTKRFSPILTPYRKISNPTEITHWETVKREKFSLRVSQFGFLMLISVDKLSKLHSGRYRWPQNSIKSMTWIKDFGIIWALKVKNCYQLCSIPLDAYTSSCSIPKTEPEDGAWKVLGTSR